MRNATRYEELAAYARAKGYSPVTGPGLQHWTKRGLLPRGQPKHYGQGKRTFAYPAATGAQLLAACRLRYDEGVRDLHELAASVWLEGFALEDAVVRAALVHAAEFGRAAEVGRLLALRQGATNPSREVAIDTFAEAATSSATIPGLSARARAEAAVALADFVAASLGDAPVRDLGGLGPLAGLTPAGISTLEQIVGTFAPDVVAAKIGAASAAELRAVRAAAVRGAAVLEPGALPQVANINKRRMAILLAAGLLIHRDQPVFADVLAAAETDGRESGASALRILR